MPWFLYVLRCADGAFYIGIAQDTEERVRRHNSGDGALFTGERRPVTLVYTEEYSSYVEARTREIQVKKWGRRKKEQLITQHTQGAFFGPSVNETSGRTSIVGRPSLRSGQNRPAILPG